MSSGVNIGTAFLTIVPTVQGIQGSLSSQLGALQGEADRTGGSTGESFLGGLKGKAMAGIAGIGLAVGAAFADAFAEAVRVNKGQAKLQASLGLDSTQAKLFGKSAGSLYAKGYGESISELLPTLGDVSTALNISNTADLEKATGRVLSFAQAFDTDASDAIQHVSTLMKSGLVGSADEAFDLLTKASQKVPSALRGDIGDANDEYSQFFRTLGFSGQQAFDALVVGADKGTFGIDKTGDAIKEFTIRSTDMSKSSVAAYESIGLNAQDMSNAILAGGDTAHDAFLKIVDGIEGIQDPTARSNTAIALFGTQMEDMNVGDVPTFLEGLKGMSGRMDDAAGSADAMDQAMGSTTTSIDLLWRNIKTSLVDFINDTVLPALSKFSTWFWDTFGPAITTAGAWIQDTLVPAVQQLVVWLGDTLGPVVEKAGAFFRDALIPFLKEAWEWFSVNLLPAIQTVASFIGSTFENIAAVIGGIIDFLTGVFTGDWSKAWDGIKGIFGGIWDQIKNTLQFAWDTIVGLITSLGPTVLGLIDSFFNFMVEKGSEFLGWLWQGIQNKAVEVWAWFTSLPGWIWDKVAAAAGWVLARGSEFIGWIKSGIETGAQSIWDWFTSLPGRIWDGLVALKDKILQIGKDFIGWIVEGVKSVAGDIWNAITDAFTVQADSFSQNPLAYLGQNADGGKMARGQLVAKAGGGTIVDFLAAEQQYGRNWVRPNGMINGPGGPRSDIIPTWLSAGEFVGNAASVAMFGDAYEALNAGKPDKAMWSLLPYMADGGAVAKLQTKNAAFQFGKDLALGLKAQVVEALKQGAGAAGGFNSSQDPSSFGWQRAANIQPLSWNGFTAFVAGGTQGLWAALLDRIAPTIPGGIATLGGFANRNNVNSPGVPSFHSYGLAMDVNAAWNPNGVNPANIQGGKYVIPIGPARAAASALGMLWGGDFNGTKDPMHFEIHLSPQAVAAAGGGSGGGLGAALAGAIRGKLGVSSANYTPTAGVEQWRGTVLQALGITGQSASLANIVLNQMRTESSGDPRAMNNWDRNALAGNASRGLMQVVPSTFAAYRLPGLSGDIFDPLSNIVAAIRYTISRYGSVAAGMQGHAYDDGGWLMPGGRGVNLMNKPEAVLTPSQSQALLTHARAIEDGYAGRAPSIQVGDIHMASADPAEVMDELFWRARVAAR